MYRTLWDLYRKLSVIMFSIFLFALFISRVPTPQSLVTFSGTATECTYDLGAPWCPRAGCIGLAEWQSLVSDGRILGALIIAYQNAPEWRPLAQASVKRGTRIVVGSLHDSYGIYRYGENAITIDDALLHDDVSVLAIVLGHEVFHSSISLAQVSAAACFEEEAAAYLWEWYIWQRVRRGNEQSDLARFENTLGERISQHTLNAFVMGNLVHQEHCLGRRLEDH